MNLLKNNKNIKVIIADHWKSLELIKTNKQKICLFILKKLIIHWGHRLIAAEKILDNVDNIISNSEYTKNLAISCGLILKKLQ